MVQELEVQQMLERRAREKTNEVIRAVRQEIKDNPILSNLQFKIDPDLDSPTYTLLQVIKEHPMTSPDRARRTFEEDTNINKIESKIFNNFLAQEIQDLERAMNSTKK